MPRGTEGPIRTEVGRRAHVAYLEHRLRKGDLRAASDSVHCSLAGAMPERSKEEKEMAALQNLRRALSVRDPGFQPVLF